MNWMLRRGSELRGSIGRPKSLTWYAKGEYLAEVGRVYNTDELATTTRLESVANA